MLSWNISVYKQDSDGSSQATSESVTGVRLAVWQTGLEGLDWIEKLVKTGKVISLGGGGYPSRYTATAQNLVPQIINEPPMANQAWVRDENDIIMEGWEGKTVINHTDAAACRPDEWLLIEAWDESQPYTKCYCQCDVVWGVICKNCKFLF